MKRRPVCKYCARRLDPTPGDIARMAFYEQSSKVAADVAFWCGTEVADGKRVRDWFEDIARRLSLKFPSAGSYDREASEPTATGCTNPAEELIQAAWDEAGEKATRRKAHGARS